MGYVPDFVTKAVGKYQSSVALILCCDVLHALNKTSWHCDTMQMILSDSSLDSEAKEITGSLQIHSGSQSYFSALPFCHRV